MAIRKHLCLIVSLFLLIPHSSATETVVKAGYWFPASEFPVSDINSTLFTHLFCAFAGIDPQTNQVNISSTDRVAFSTFTQTAQQKNPDLKTLLSIGGGSSTSTSEYLASMVSQPASRKIFINSSIKRARENGFHGLDLDWDWKYPETAEKMANMGTFFDEWRDSAATESRDSGKPELILTAAVYYSARFNSNTYPINSIERSLDWVNVMAYDFSAPGWSHNYTGPPAALYNPTGPVSTSSGINAWIGNGLSANKILLGLPFYGYAWKLLDPKNHIVGAPANGSALSEDGSQTYKQIKEFIGKTGATLVHDAKMVMDYCYIGSTWIGFDDLKTVAAKVTYVKQNGLRGYYGWSVSADDNWALALKDRNFVLEDGSQTYKQIKEFIGKTGATLVHDAKMVMDYCYIGSTWIGFDDLKTVAAKVTYVKQKGLRGYYGWSVSADDNWALALKASETWDSTPLPRKNVGPTSMQPLEKNINLSISMYFIIIQIVFAFWGNHL